MFDKKYLGFVLLVVYFRSGLLDDDLLSQKRSGLFADSPSLLVVVLAVAVFCQCLFLL